MNILLISQCSGRAINETRRILDQFAERRGTRTWQTPITQQGLDTLRRLLRKTARRNTAVACHWIRGRDHSELLWLVGDAKRFNDHGAVPTNTTQRNMLRSQDENDWHTAADIRLLAKLASLFHDIGKANAAFERANPRKTSPCCQTMRVKLCDSIEERTMAIGNKSTTYLTVPISNWDHVSSFGQRRIIWLL